MAVAPITQPTAAGIDPVDYSPWSQAAQARSALPGILNYVPNASTLPAPTATPAFQGASEYGNYVRHWPDLLAAFQNPNQAAGHQNIQDWGKWHWLTHGQHTQLELRMVLQSYLLIPLYLWVILWILVGPAQG